MNPGDKLGGYEIVEVEASQIQLTINGLLGH